MPDPTVSQADSKVGTGNDRFGRVMGILMATLAIVAAVLASLEVDAGSRSAVASRQARRFSIEALGRRSSGEMAVGYGLYSAQAWYELSMLAHSAEQSYDAVAAQRYQSVRDHLATLSPFLSDYSTDLARYEADIYLIEATVLAERSAAAMAQEDAWDAKANAYLSHLTLLAVALALYGLATIFSGRTRRILAGTGSVIVAAIVVWAGLVYRQPVIDLPDAAIGHYAQGVGLAHQGEYRAAVAAFDDARAEAPHYANALFERGNAHYFLQDYEAAVADYEAAQAAGRDDVSVAWNLGWTYYLLGRFDEAVQADRHALAMDADQVAIRLNLGLALLASGQGEAAQVEYDAAMELSAQQVAQAQAAGLELPYSFWYYLDVGARDLESLLAQVDDQLHPWMEAPPAEAIAPTDASLDLARNLVDELKELSVSLEQTGRPAAGTGPAHVTTFHFTRPMAGGGGGFAPAQPRTPFEAGIPLDSDTSIFFPEAYDTEATWQRPWSLEDHESDYTDTFAYGSKSVGIEFDYEGIQAGQSVLWKVYRNGVEDRSLRWMESWSLESAGGARKDLNFAFGGAGLYEVELYVDGHLAQRGSFTVEPPAAEALRPTVLFEDDFADSGSGNWALTTAEGYTTEYVDGRYRIYAGQGDLYVRSSLQGNYTDVGIEVDAQKAFGTSDANTFGAICRFQDAGGWNGYIFLISGDGRYGIGKWQEGHLTWLREMRSSTAVRRGRASNHIRAECDGGTMTLYVNGEYLTSAHDEEFSSGQVSLVVGSAPDSREADVYFDNFVLIRLGPTEPR